MEESKENLDTQILNLRQDFMAITGKEDAHTAEYYLSMCNNDLQVNLLLNRLLFNFILMEK